MTDPRSGTGQGGLPPAAGDGTAALRVASSAATGLPGDPIVTFVPGARSEDGATPTVVDGVPTDVVLEVLAADEARLVERDGAGERRTHVRFGPARQDPGRGILEREVVVDGWRFELELEPERRAALRERARRGASMASHGGPVEVRAIIPGRISAVSVAADEAVEAGQELLVVEAMKMQNELRAPREGTIVRIAVAVGDTIEVGDLLVVIH